MPEVRPIDANAAADKIMHGVEVHADEIGIGAVAIMIAFARALRDETDFPTIEPEVRHGRWIVHTTWHGMFGLIHSQCSECKFDRNGDLSSWKFCPHCGARMDATDTKGGEQE